MFDVDNQHKVKDDTTPCRLAVKLKKQLRLGRDGYPNVIFYNIVRRREVGQ